MSTSTSSLVQFTSSQTPGYDVVAALSALSALSMVFVGLHVFVKWATSLFKDSKRWDASKERSLVATEIGRYIICLILACLITTSSGLVSGEFARTKSIRIPSIACTAQSILAQMGYLSTAYFTVILAIHTILTLVFHCRQSRRFGWAIISVGWALTAVFAVVPSKVFGFEGVMCGIDIASTGMQFFFHLLPVYLALMLLIVGSILMHFTLRGAVIFGAGKKYHHNDQFQWSHENAHDDYHGFVGKLASRLQLFFLAYIIMVLPYGVTKTIDLVGIPQPFVLHVICDACVYLLGFINVIILYMIYRALGPASESSTSKSDDLEKSGANAEAKKGTEKRRSMVDMMRNAFPKRKMTQPASRTKKLAQAIKNAQAPRVRNLTQTHQRNDSTSSVARLMPAPVLEERSYDADARIIPAAEIARIIEAAPAPAERAITRTKEVSKRGPPREIADPPPHEPVPEVVSLSPPPRAARAAPPASANDVLQGAKNGQVTIKRLLPSRPNEGRAPKSAGVALAAPQSAKAGHAFYSPAVPRPSSKEEIDSFSSRPLPSAPAATSKSYHGEERDISEPMTSKSAKSIRSAKHTGGFQQAPDLSVMLQDSDDNSEPEYPAVPALVLPAHKRRDGLPARGPFLKRGNNDAPKPAAARVNPAEADIGSSSVWAQLAEVSLATPRTAISAGLSAGRAMINGRRKMEPTAQSATSNRGFPQLRTPATAQAPRLVVPGSANGAPKSANLYF